MSERREQYLVASQQALIDVVETLAEGPLSHSSVAEIIEATGHPRDAVFRALQNLAYRGWAESPPGGGWRLAPGLVAIAERLRLAIAELHRRYFPGD
ncbi:MAG: helix-turn-helix domain-containing protein [Gammaproteobacteria bacterium]|nr:helix-turn-helix domain-containing protein [Gammaproteobacteria bacterium]